MRAGQVRIAVIMFVTVSFVVAAQAQESTPCVSNVPNPYHLVDHWIQSQGPEVDGNTVATDSHDNVWFFTRCGKGCSGSSEAPIWEVSADGKVMKNFGAGMFALAHGLAIDKDGNVWAADGGESLFRSGPTTMGPKVVKLSPDGKLLLSLDEPGGQPGKGLDVSDRPSGLAIAPNGDIFIADGHREGAEGQEQTFGNSRILKYDKNGKFIKSFGHLGTGDGELMSPHALAFDSQGRLFVADRSNLRLSIFDQEGNFLMSWKQFGRPSGVAIDKNDTLYVTDNLSEANPPKNTMWWPPEPGCPHGVRVGSAKTGKVDYYFPHPLVPSPLAEKLRLTFIDAESIAVDSHGSIYLKSTRVGSYKFVK